MSAHELRDRLADCGLMRVRMRTIDDGTLAQVRAIDAETAWNGGELIVSGRATLRPRVLEVLQRAGAEIHDLTTQEGRLDDIYRACVERHQ